MPGLKVLLPDHSVRAELEVQPNGLTHPSTHCGSFIFHPTGPIGIVRGIDGRYSSFHNWVMSSGEIKVGSRQGHAIPPDHGAVLWLTGVQPELVDVELIDFDARVETEVGEFLRPGGIQNVGQEPVFDGVFTRRTQVFPVDPEFMTLTVFVAHILEQRNRIPHEIRLDP